MNDDCEVREEDLVEGGRAPGGREDVLLDVAGREAREAREESTGACAAY